MNYAAQAKRVGWIVLRLVATPPLFVVMCLFLAAYWLCRVAFSAAEFIWTGDP